MNRMGISNYYEDVDNQCFLMFVLIVHELVA